MRGCGEQDEPCGQGFGGDDWARMFILGGFTVAVYSNWALGLRRRDLKLIPKGETRGVSNAYPVASNASFAGWLGGLRC